MAMMTRSTRQSIDRLVDFYEQEGRVAALLKLLKVLEDVASLLSDPERYPSTRSYPSVYKEIAPYGIRWFKLHVYWFGYVVKPDGAVLTNFFHEVGNMPGRLSLDSDDLIGF